MSQQLLIALEPDSADSENQYRWCWLSEGRAFNEGQGTLSVLAGFLGNVSQQAWLILPGNRVVVRALEYSEKEKKHLRSLLPYQLEDAVVGDVEDFHFALGTPSQGKVELAYAEKSWLRKIFDECASVGLEVSRCLVLPQLLTSSEVSNSIRDSFAQQNNNLASENNESFEETNSSQVWQLALHQGLVNVLLPDQPAFSVPLEHLKLALNLAIQEKKLEKSLPQLLLRAEEATDLSQLEQALSPELKQSVKEKSIASLWYLNLATNNINLCQAEFSQRLPFERCWKQWKNIAIFALVTLLVYVAVTGLQLYKANKQNLFLRQQIEAQFREVNPTGPADNPEGLLRSKWVKLQPKAQGASVTSLFVGVVPVIAANPDINLRVVSYADETGELTLSIQAHNFAAIEELRQSLANKGFNADILTANAQGDLNSARIKVSKQ